MKESVLSKKIVGLQSEGACREDELIGGKPPIVKQLLTLALTTKSVFS
jgi:hypothetical protein